MANTDTPNGFWPAVGTGGSTTPQVREYAVRPGGASIGQGDVVVLTATGASLCVSANNSYILGVAQHQWTSLSSIRTLKVFDNPRQLFQAQQDGVVGANAVGANFSLVVTTRHTTTLISQMEIDSSTSAASQVLHPIQMIAVARKVDANSVDVSWTKCIVQFNEAFHIWTKTGTLAGI